MFGLMRATTARSLHAIRPSDQEALRVTDISSSRLTRRHVLGLALASVVVAACGTGEEPKEASGPGVDVVSAEHAAEIVADGSERLFILDVRTAEEYAEAHIEGAELIDIQRPDFADRVTALDRDLQYVLYCRSGNRSERARRLMTELGFREVHDIEGGIVAWIDAGLPVVSA